MTAKKSDEKHMSIIESDSFVADLNALYYDDSNEKSLLREKLSQLLLGTYYSSAIDLGAGPGFAAGVLQQHAKDLTLVEITDDYYDVLKHKFPHARIEIKSILDFEFTQHYDVILLSHVLYYIAVDEWENLLKKLYRHLAPGGKLIVVHAPCHHIHRIFQAVPETEKCVSYMNESALEQLMNRIGPYERDDFVSTSHCSEEFSLAFAEKYASKFFGFEQAPSSLVSHEELEKLLTIFRQNNGKLDLDYHNDIYVFSK